MLKQACRHVEYFVEALFSVEAGEQWLKNGGQGSLAHQHYVKPSTRLGRGLHFEHAVPADDIFQALMELGKECSADDVCTVLEAAEIVWITQKQAIDLREELKNRPKGRRTDWRDVYRAAGITLYATSPALSEGRA
jgi:hypothetical protein